MYVPPHFRVDAPAALHRHIRENAFGLLATSGDPPEITHLPFVLDADAGAHGVLYGHVARANPHARLIAEGATAVAVFSGPHAYVSPTWYASAPAVPTWNYAAVHAHGRLRPLEEDQLLAQLRALSGIYEGTGPGAWSLDALPDRFLAGMVKGIVGFALAIERLDGKFKLSQNRPEADRAGVLAGLAARPEPEAAATRALMTAMAAGDRGGGTPRG